MFPHGGCFPQWGESWSGGEEGGGAVYIYGSPHPPTLEHSVLRLRFEQPEVDHVARKIESVLRRRIFLVEHPGVELHLSAVCFVLERRVARG